MNQRLQQLHQYPFAKLRELLSGSLPPANLAAISLAVGEPQHAPPAQAVQALTGSLNRLNAYPATPGDAPFRQAIAKWIEQRYDIASLIDPETMVLPVQGTREALFAVAQVVVNTSCSQHSSKKPLVFMPSPFYQIYEGAAIMAGAEPYYMPCNKANGFVPDLDAVDDALWQRCQFIYLCSPSNPTGALLSANFYKRLLALADQHNFVVVSDECYSEIYFDESAPCTGLLDVCKQLGRSDFNRCLVFNSLSKRSNLAGLRSGFVAGDAELIKAFLLYRTYHGSAMPFHHQRASEAAWADEQHVIDNRALYREKMATVVPMLQSCLALEIPAGGFCVWAKTPINDEQFTRELFASQHVTVLPGGYLARTINGENPGENYIRIALVQSLAQCVEAAERISNYVAGLRC